MLDRRSLLGLFPALPLALAAKAAAPKAPEPIPLRPADDFPRGYLMVKADRDHPIKAGPNTYYPIQEMIWTGDRWIRAASPEGLALMGELGGVA